MSAQLAAFLFLVSSNLRFSRLRPEPSGPSRGLASLAEPLSVFEKKWTSLKERPVISIDVGLGCAALPVDPKRIQVPDVAGTLIQPLCCLNPVLTVGAARIALRCAAGATKVLLQSGRGR